MFDRDEQEISQIIETGLEAVRTGKTTLDHITAEYPGQATTIRSEIEAALWLASFQENLAPRPGFVAASRKRVIERIKQEARNEGTKHAFFGFAWPKRIAYQWAVAILLVVFILSGTGGAVTFAQDALPGDGLYGLKRITEDLTVAMTMGDAGKADLNTQFSNRRLDEVAKLIDHGNVEQVPPTLHLYKQQLGQAILQLQQAARTQPAQKKTLALAVKSQLAVQAERLDGLLAIAPPSIVQPIQDAKQAADQSTSAADKFINPPGLPENTKTPGKADKSTETPASTATNTNTPPAGNTPAAGVTDSPVPQDTDTPDAVQSTPVPDPDAVLEVPTDVPQDTLVPADNAKKVKTPKPSTGNNGNNGNNGQQPDQKPKKDKDTGPNNKPPKDNGSNNGSSPPVEEKPTKPPKN